MRMPLSLLFATFVALAGTTAFGQTIDLSRGALPLRVPSSHDADRPAPLIVLLHGYGSSGARIESYLKLGEFVDSHGFFLVHPDGTEATGERNPRFWNASKACCNFGDQTVDDSAYVLSVINAFKAAYEIDPKRVYLVGHSNGGFMSYRAAHEHSGTIAAIVSLAGAASTDDRPAPPNPVHILQIHGTDDPTIKYDGDEIRGSTYPGAVETVERWAEYNGCAAPGREAGTLDLDGEIPGMETTVTQHTKDCAAGGSSELWTIAGGDHSPSLSDSFSMKVVEWLLSHPKP